MTEFYLYARKKKEKKRLPLRFLNSNYNLFCGKVLFPGVEITLHWLWLCMSLHQLQRLYP